MSKFTDRLQHAWNAFMNKDPTFHPATSGPGSSYRPDKHRINRTYDKTITTSVFNRIAMDCAAIDIQHVKLDDQGRYIETMDTALNNCLTLEANIDQTARAFRQDTVLSMFDDGCVAIVPVDTVLDPERSQGVDIETMRTGKIVEWYPSEVKIDLYNERTGKHAQIVMDKRSVCIIENPLYAVMNAPNSTAQRLIRKLNLLDVIDEQSSSGKLDMIIQLPYAIKSEARLQQADKRRKTLEDQLTNSKYGIAYIDGTEKITQLNRSLENNLMQQIEYLTSMLYSQLGVTNEIMDGTADDKVMLNYNNRTIEPIMSAIVDEMKRKFLSKTARTQGKSIKFFRDPFKLTPVSDLAEIADKFTRNEILSSNEIRQIIGMKPVDSPQADELRNKNLNPGEGQEFASTDEMANMEGYPPEEGEMTDEAYSEDAPM